MTTTAEAWLTSILYQVSNALMVPVLVAVLLLFATVLVIGGGFLRECLDRWSIRRTLTRAVSLCDPTPPNTAEVWAVLTTVEMGLPAEFAEQQLLQQPHRLGYRLRSLETTVAARLARLAFLAKVGPILGLLGTLIPFGPALAGLSSGDVKLLSANLVAAFATTVVGLLSGCLAFGIGMVRKGWYASDLDALEYIVERLSQELMRQERFNHEEETQNVGA